MRRKIIFMFLLLLFSGLIAQEPARELVAISNLDSRVELYWKPPIEPIELVLWRADDGTSGKTDNSSVFDIISVRYVADARCSLIAMRYYGAYMFSGVRVQIQVFKDNTIGGPDIFSPLIAYPETTELHFGWDTVYFADHGLIFSAGDTFHIGIGMIDTPWTPIPGIVFADTIPSGRSYHYHAPVSLEPFYGDYWIHAIVAYRDGSLRELPIAKVVKSVNEPVHESRFFMAPPGLTGYELFRSNYPDPESLVFLASKSDTDTFYNDTSAVNDEGYYYAVRAKYGPTTYSQFTKMAYAVPRNDDITATYDTVKVDDGLIDATVSWTSGRGWATYLPFERIGKLRSLLIMVTNAGNFRPQILTSAADTTPDSVLVDWIAALSATPGWRDVNVSSWKTFIVDEPIFAACIVDDRYFAIGIDTSFEAKSFDYNGADWLEVRDSIYMIRYIIEYRDNEAYYHIRRGWNLISLPVFVDKDSVVDIFPMAVGGIAYAGNFDVESRKFLYEEVQTVEPGIGYWILSTVDTMFVVHGDIPARSFDIAVNPGWNMIGVPAGHDGFPIRSIETYPDDLITGSMIIFSYDAKAKMFVEPEKLFSGFGYFVWASKSGVLRINR